MDCRLSKRKTFVKLSSLYWCWPERRRSRKAIDKWLSTELTKRLVQIAKHEKLGSLVAYTLRENKDMQTMCKKVGFKVRTPVGESECVIEMEL
jgi:hypothetical protein